MVTWKKAFERDYTAQYWENAMYMEDKDTCRYIVSPNETIAVYKEGRTAACFLSKEELEKHNKDIFNHYSDVKKTHDFLDYFIKTGKKYINLANRFGQKPKGDLSTKYSEYWKLWSEYTAALWLTFELNDLFADRLCEFIEKRYEEVKPEPSLSRVFSHCLRPWKIAGTVQAGIDALEVKKNYNSKTLEAFQKKYAWFTCLDLNFEPLTLQGAKEIIETTQPIEKKHIAIDSKKLLKLSEEESEFVNLGRMYFYVKDLRDEFRRKGVFHITPLYKEISRELGTSYSQTYSLLRDEIIAGLNGEKINLKEADARLKGNFFMWKEGNGVKCITGSNADEKAKRLGITGVKATNTPVVLKGVPASKGIIRGKVRLVKVAVHLHRVQKGEVLVALTTNPNYLTAMNIASAIVTDEGGLTSHAAIIARELKKPCVVGTKIATKVLNDGDMIEVNGETGEVKLL